MSSEIVAVVGRQVWDSRGRPTVEAEVRLSSGAVGRAIAPSGASTGAREALDLRDGEQRQSGLGVNRALGGIATEIAPTLIGRDAGDQSGIDRALIALDGTPQKTRLGGNALVAVSIAVAQAAAADAGLPLWAHLRGLAGLDAGRAHIPLPMIQIFGGGRHAGNRIDVQDYLVMAIGATSFAEAMEWTAEIYLAAAAVMKRRGRLMGVADEGGLWPDFTANEDGLVLLTEAIAAAGFEPGREIGIALDIAATSFAAEGGYRLALEGRTLSGEQLVEMIAGWCDRFAIVSVEDPVGEDDDEGFVLATERLGHRVQIVGDDYLTTDAARIGAAGARGACNTALLKANQCGTLSELIDAAAAARALGWNAVQSGRSGESEDVSLAHLAVGLMSDQIKVGSMTRSERTAKWNEVIRIEQAVGRGGFAGFSLPRG